jgi:hypothetical protein
LFVIVVMLADGNRPGVMTPLEAMKVIILAVCFENSIGW